jgi:pyrroline-5-carboxylate reductase
LLAGLLASGRTTDELVFTERHPERAAELTGGASASRASTSPTPPRGPSARRRGQAAGHRPVLAELAPVLPPGTLVVTLCAGLPIALFEARCRKARPWCGSCPTPRCWSARR